MRSLLICFLILNSIVVEGQIFSGEYDSDLRIAYNPESKTITGYYEGYSGYDENTGNPRFSCIFYIIGKYLNNESIIETYFPKNKEKDKIIGKLKIKDSSIISISLPEEHGGCWNVNHFADGFVDFNLHTKEDWIEIRYIETEKSNFYSENNENSKRKSYLIKGDIVFIDKIDGEWIHCYYYGKSITTGWIKKETINN